MACKPDQNQCEEAPLHFKSMLEKQQSVLETIHKQLLDKTEAMHEGFLHHTEEISELKEKVSKLTEMQPEHVTDKEYIGVLLAQIKEQQDAYVILYDRNVVLSKELTEANNIIAAAKQTKQALETHSSSQ
jgi:hypothetical protein